jgi:RNA polymerase sigma-70 factor (ECF subfamily)
MSDAQQFEAFMKDYQNMVYSTALRLVANPAEAEDIAQEVFLKAYTRFAELRASPTAGGWLKTVATNMSLNHLSRYRSRWSFFSELAAPGEDEQEIEWPDEAQSIEDAIADADRHKTLQKALFELPKDQRVALVLYHLEGFRYEEIATRLKVSLGKVKTDISRAREALRKRLGLKFGGELKTA